MKKAALFLICLTLFVVEAFATEYGTIKYLLTAGPNDPNHPNVVQLNFGAPVLNVAGCNQYFAAIRKDGKNDHLIILAMTAAAEKKQVIMELNPADVYYTPDSRCTISRLSVQY